MWILPGLSSLSFSPEQSPFSLAFEFHVPTSLFHRRTPNPPSLSKPDPSRDQHADAVTYQSSPVYRLHPVELLQRRSRSWFQGILDTTSQGDLSW